MAKQQSALIRHEQQVNECGLIKEEHKCNLQWFHQQYQVFLTLTTQEQHYYKVKYWDTSLHVHLNDSSGTRQIIISLDMIY